MNTREFLTTLLSVTMLCSSLSAHNGLTTGHSPLDPNTPPTEEEPCPTLDPFKLFLLPDPGSGGPLLPGQEFPSEMPVPSELTHVAFNALLGKPEFGGLVYSEDSPGLHYVDAENECHALTLEHTDGVPFTISLLRSYIYDGANLVIGDTFGTAILLEDGDGHEYGDENGAHFHPLWMTRRAGMYAGGFGVGSDFFLASDEFSLVFVSDPACWTAVPLDLSGVFNADVVDSDATDDPTAFDGAGHFWVLDEVYGTDRGLPVDGALDVFQLGGPDAAGLLGGERNCLFDDGVLSSAATIDLVASGQSGEYQSMELLIAASGTFTSSDQLLVRLNYATGSQQVVTVRQAVFLPRFFPIADWHISAELPPQLSVGPGGGRDGGGFVRSNGGAIDTAPDPDDSFYFQRVTFPLDQARTLQSVAFDNYTGMGRLGIFATTLIASEPCPTGDADLDGDVDLFDFAAFGTCLSGPGSVFIEPECDTFDFDRDEDVDFQDFGGLQARFTEI